MSDHETKRPFLSRTSLSGRLGLPNYFVILLVGVFIMPFVTRGARFAVQTNNNNVADWLPESYPESTVLKWFHQNFIGESFAVVSWDGNTLGNTQRLELFVKKVRGSQPESDEAADASAPPAEKRDPRQELFRDVITGPAVLEQLTAPPLSLEYDEALQRIEGSLVGPIPEGGTNEDRVTCAVVMLSDLARSSNKAKRAAIEALAEIATQECNVPEADLRLGGPPVDNVTIDIEGERTLVMLAGLAGLVGLGLSYLCFRSVRLTIMVFLVGGFSALLSLAFVFYFSVFEVFGLGYDRPHLGSVDAILMSMPAVVYVLGLSGAIHIVNYFRDSIRDHGMTAAAERAVMHGWKPCVLAALTTAVGLATLYISDITPIRKFGMFSAIGVLGTLTLLFTILPACLYRFAPPNGGLPVDDDSSGTSHHPRFSNLMHGIGRFIIERNGWVAACTVVVMGLFGYGMTRIQTEVQLLKLFDPNADIIHDYRWLETHLGNLVPMEVVVALDETQIRGQDQDPEADGKHYRMNMLERLELLQVTQRRIESIEHIGRAMTAATFAPDLDVEKNAMMRVVGLDPRITLSNQLERHREELIREGYIQDEVDARGKPTGGELLRVSARLAALADIDYGLFVADVQKQVEPVLSLYRQRDDVLRNLHEQGKRLRLSNLVLLYDNDPEHPNPEVTWQVNLLQQLLTKAGARLKAINLARLPTDETRAAVVARLRKGVALRDAVIDATQGDVAVMGDITKDAPLVVDVRLLTPDQIEPNTNVLPSEDGKTISAAYTGLVPLVYKTQRQLLVSLQESIGWACGLIAIVMVVVFRSFSAGMMTMIPNVFPIVLIFGGMGLFGIRVDIGTMMTASVALGVAVDDTVHFLTWFRDGIRMGMDRKQAVMLAYERCGSAMLQTTIVGGLGLSVFAVSSFMPTHQFGILMGTLLVAALIGDLIVLPAMLAGPVGRFFTGNVVVDRAESSGTASESSDDLKPHLPRVATHTRRDSAHRNAS